MRALALIFVVLILVLQYPMWLGRGGWLQVRELGRQIDRQQAVNAGLEARNGALEAEVRDLKQGFEAIEERARSELGMLKRDEVFFLLQDAGGISPAGSASATFPPPVSSVPPMSGTGTLPGAGEPTPAGGSRPR